MRYFVLLAATLLCGCAIATSTSTPDGSKGYAVHCGMVVSACFDKAAEMCGGQYTIIDRITQGTANNLIVSCKKP